MTNAEHLARLEGAAFEVATDYLRAFPGAVLLSSARDVQEQATAMAKNCFRQRNWILGGNGDRAVYHWCLASVKLHTWSVAHQLASVVDIAAAFTSILAALPRAELEKLSRHLVPPGEKARAFDAQVNGNQAEDDWLAEQARARGGVFLDKEGEIRVRHWQAGAIEAGSGPVCVG